MLGVFFLFLFFLFSFVGVFFSSFLNLFNSFWGLSQNLGLQKVGGGGVRVGVTKGRFFCCALVVGSS